MQAPGDANAAGPGAPEPVVVKYKVTMQAMRDMVTSLRNKMRMQAEPLEELSQIMTLLKEVQAD